VHYPSGNLSWGIYVDDNWTPLLNGVSGVLKKGVSAVFTLHWFDAISTTAEECKDPQRDLPRGMMAIIICTIFILLLL
jgi:amino acid transporter